MENALTEFYFSIISFPSHAKLTEDISWLFARELGEVVGSKTPSLRFWLLEIL